MTTKPFLLLQSRPEDEASDNEYEAFVKFGLLKPEELIRVRMEAGEYPNISLANYSGIIMGGGPANFATPETEKPQSQIEMERYLRPILKEIIAKDYPFLGACLGVGALITTEGGTMCFTVNEPVGATDITLNEKGLEDDLCQGIAPTFRAFVGHKEGAKTIPENCQILAHSDVCVQMFRIGRNVYATQFHPELEANGLNLRIDIYKHEGYFDATEAESLKEASLKETITEPQKFLESFVKKYRR